MSFPVLTGSEVRLCKNNFILHFGGNIHREYDLRVASAISAVRSTKSVAACSQDDATTTARSSRPTWLAADTYDNQYYQRTTYELKFG